MHCEKVLSNLDIQLKNMLNFSLKMITLSGPLDQIWMAEMGANSQVDFIPQNHCSSVFLFNGDRSRRTEKSINLEPWSYNLQEGP